MLSICIPTYNEGECLVRTVESVVAVSDEIPGAEIVIADDGGTDDSVAECLRRWPQVRVGRHPKPCGTSCAKALAADTARGDVLIFLDAHTKPAPGSLARLSAVAESHGVAAPAVDGLDVETWSPRKLRSSGMYVDLAGNWHCLWIGRDRLPAIGDVLWRSYAIPGQSFAIRRDVYDAVGGWDRGLIAWGSDASLSLRLYCLGYTVAHCPEARVAHRFARGFVQYRPHWWQIFANRLRILRSLGTAEEIQRFGEAMLRNANALAEATQYTDARDHTISRLQGRLTRSLLEYLDEATGGQQREPWTQVEGWLSLAEGQELQRLAAGKRVLEIGAYRGRSTCCLGAVCQSITSVDPHDCATLPRHYRRTPSLDDFRRNTQHLGNKLTAIVEPIEAVADQLPAGSFDLVFVDGDHRGAAVRRDLAIAEQLLAPGGVIAAHDYGQRHGVTAAVDSLSRPLRRVGTLAILSLD